MPPKYNAPKVALLDSISPSAGEAFGSAGFEVVEYPKDITPSDLADLAQEVNVLGVRSGPKITATTQAGNLEAIGVFGVGTNHIDIEGDDGSNSKGIAVFNSAHENTRSVAELVIGSTFALMRGLADHNSQLHEGVWSKQNGSELRGKTMGIVGYGTIGLQVSVMAEALGMDVQAYDPQPQAAPQGRAKMVRNLDDLLRASDVVTLHVPAIKETIGMIDAKKLAMMKHSAYLINAARAELVDYEALKLAIENGELAGAAIDVFGQDNEPGKKGDSFDHILRGVPNTLLTAHIGGSTVEAQDMIGSTVAGRIIDYLYKGSSNGSVNIPNIALSPEEPGITRILNIHDNTPGVVNELSGIISDVGLNVAGTVQRARGELGYVAFDVEGEVGQEAITALSALKHSRRTKVL